MSSLLPFHEQFPDKFRSQTTFGQYEKIYRRPPTIKNKKSKQYEEQCAEEAVKLSKVIDFDNIANNTEHHRNNIIQLLSSNCDRSMLGYSSFPGLFILPNYLSTQQQFEWIQRAIRKFSSAPYNNLSNLKDSEATTWKEAVRQNDIKKFRSLTCCNVGIKYNWTQRQYDLDTITAPIPPSMLKLCSECNNLLSDKLKYCDDNEKERSFAIAMIPQTSIINFFEVNTKRPMGGHRDAAELINAPLISVSLGNDAIFLISQDDNTEPLPLWLRSGSVLIMSGGARFALHSVARVVPGSCSSELIQLFDEQIECAQGEENKKEMELMKKYIMSSRVNFNIRQVIANKCASTEATGCFHTIHSF